MLVQEKAAEWANGWALAGKLTQAEAGSDHICVTTSSADCLGQAEVTVEGVSEAMDTSAPPVERHARRLLP